AALKELFKDDLDTFSYYWLEKPTGKRARKKVSIDLKAKQNLKIFEEGFQNLENLVQQIKHSKFESRPASLYNCKRCAFLLLCDLNVIDEE
ncbi:hypothetical protein ACFL4A_03380, partial [bacterium]